MTTPSNSPDNDPNLSGLGRALLDTGGSKPSGPWVPPTAEELHAILPQYEIVKMLGRGGMGAVYMGTQTALERPVAIKILSAQLEESDLGFTERFKNEAKAMAKLNHPGIVAVYDFGEAPGGLLYIVMEYVDGTDVAKMIAKSGRLHTEHAMAITAHVCDALAYAHERGIIHRDIKPANIMVGYDGAVKVADFGLAKVNVGGKTLGLTMSGMAMGTMHYMAPEALMLGTSVDHRADIYAVGVMLYQMLTGKLPQGMFKLPSLLVPGLDPRYDAIVRKALMEDRESRYQGIREMRAELDSILTQPVMKVEPAASAAEVKAAALPTGARPQRPGGRPPARPASTSAQTISHERQRGSLAWLWLTLLVLAGVGGWYMFTSTKPLPVVSGGVSTSRSSITLRTPDAARILPLEKGQSRLYDSNPLRVIEEIDPSLAGWQFTSIPQRIDNAYEVSVSQSGTLYAFGGLHKGYTKEDVFGKDAPLWKAADQAIQGTMIKMCYSREVKAGDSFRMKAFELQLAATQITLEITPAVAASGKNTAPTAESTSKAPSVVTTPAAMQVPTTGDSSQQATDGWISLFNGKDLSGWELHPSNFPADVFGGLIRIRGSSTIPVSGNMYYRGSGSTLPQWTDFELICTVMTENKGNSGIFLHSSPGASEPNRANGVEVQIWNDFSKNGTVGKSGSLQSISPALTARITDGEWFQVKTRVEGKRVQTWLKKPAETEWQQAVDWTQPSDWSPRTDRPGMKLGSGTISLQNNPPIDGVVWFKEVQFRVLTEAVSSMASFASPNAAVVGLWNGVSTDNSGATSEMEILSGGQATWRGNGSEVAGTWKQTGVASVQLTWRSGWTYDLTLSPTNASLLTGESSGPDGKLVALRFEKSTTPASTVSPASLIETFNGHRYQFIPGSTSWPEAKAKAESMGGHLATLTSKEENEWLLLTYRKLLTTQNRNIWLGASESASGAGWKWVTGEPFVFTGWVVNEPNGVKGGGGQVGHPFMLNLYSFRETVGWNDSSTHFSQSRDNIGFIVEWDSAAPATTAPSPVASSTLWIDGKGRSLQAKFVRMQGGNVVLDIAGKATPVALASLSAASQQIAQTLQASLLAPASKIPSDALTFGTSRYAYYAGTFTWKEAKAKAEALGGHLATVTTAAEDAWVITNFESKVSPGRKQFWIGASQERPGLPWQWVTGETFSYTQWAPAEPNNAKGTDLKSIPPYMLGYLIQGGRMGWNDFSESQANWRDIIVGYLVEWDNAVSAGAVAPAPAEAGFITLLDADQPGDWVQVGPGKLDIQNGLATTSSPTKWGVAIYAKRTFADFILKAEFKGVGPLFNSGLWLRIPDLQNDIDRAAANRYEVGIINPGGDKGRFTGTIWGVQSARADAVKANDWNELEVTVIGQRYVVKLNGQLVNDFTGSKGVSGYIGLEENFAGPVQFRNVRVKPLP